MIKGSIENFHLFIFQIVNLMAALSNIWLSSVITCNVLTNHMQYEYNEFDICMMFAAVINECENNNTYNCPAHSTCVDTVEGYTCECINGWTGTNCEIGNHHHHHRRRRRRRRSRFRHHHRPPPPPPPPPPLHNFVCLG